MILDRQGSTAGDMSGVDVTDVSVLALPGGSAEVRICSPDAAGFGCDLARTMFDFGLVIERGDFSTDGKWSFLMFKVRLDTSVFASFCSHGHVSQAASKTIERLVNLAALNCLLFFLTCRACSSSAAWPGRSECNVARAGSAGSRPQELLLGVAQAASGASVPIGPGHHWPAVLEQTPRSAENKPEAALYFPGERMTSKHRAASVRPAGLEPLAECSVGHGPALVSASLPPFG